jgi:hypothetical protein
VAEVEPAEDGYGGPAHAGENDLDVREPVKQTRKDHPRNVHRRVGGAPATSSSRHLFMIPKP